MSPKAQELLKDWLTDPLSLLLISTTFGLVALYLLMDIVKPQLYSLKLGIIFGIIFSTVIAESVLFIMLRHQAGPASYTHDGGVIQTEEAIKLLQAGKNPYVEDYTDTPMAEWGLDYKTALYHYPYLPWTFLFPWPFYRIFEASLGWYDQRFVYLVLFVLTLIMVSFFVPKPENRLKLVAVLGLNPIMGSDVIFGQNDSFVLFWLVLSLWFLVKVKTKVGEIASAVFLALACASKPTAWFFVPFYFFYLWREKGETRALLYPIVAFALAFLVIVTPFFLWDPEAMVDDVWRWAAGTAKISYQIRGWGIANFILALGLVESRLSYFPFWILEITFTLPVAIALGLRLYRYPSLRVALWAYGLTLFIFFYFSRFLNENYLGYILAVLALGYWLNDPSLTKITARESS
ncbi:MAG: hypothetical protein RMK30_07260 [Anaerolineae bacterium]|nr:hypothetical protein [Anaerolineae bacterium]MDW8102657.1 hypothetical protein [Anaerolineae bacterium]